MHVIERLRTADGVPMAVERSHIPAALAPGLPTSRWPSRSLYDVLAATYGVLLDRGEQTIEAGIADPADAALLDLPPAQRRAAAAAAVLRRRRSGRVRGVDLPGGPLPAARRAGGLPDPAAAEPPPG